MAYPRFRRARAHKFVTKTGGNYSTTSTTYVSVDTAADLTLDAQAGDVIECGLSAIATDASATVALSVDAATIVSNAIVNYVSGAGSTGGGVMAWSIRLGDFHTAAGSAMYQLVSGDIASNLVTVRLIYKASSATGRGLQANATNPLHFWAKNLGPVDPN
jgi:hypothetical protein